MKTNNRGFTLVELIVSCAILSIIAVATAGFLVTGTRTYSSVNYSVRLQYEAQLAMSQVQEDVIDCSVGAAWDDAGKTLYLVDSGAAGQELSVLHYDETAQEILFGTGAAAQEPLTATELLAEHVTGMSVVFVPVQTNPTRAESAKITLTLERGGKSYSADQTIALRNRPQFASDWGTLWDTINR